jgi:positive regulator of sigma E activity
VASSGDPFAGFGPLPDHVPDELVASYGKSAQKSVRYSRSTRYRASRALARSISSLVSLRDADLLSSAAVILMWAVAAVAFVIGLGYATMLWPKAGLAMIGTLLILIGFSLSLAMRFARRREQQTQRALL